MAYSIQEITRLSHGDKDIMWELFNKNIGIFDSIEESIINFNFFRRYKDAVSTMTDDECMDIFKGVIYLPRRGGLVWDSVRILFDDLYDWHRLNFAFNRINNIMRHEDEPIKTAVGKFIAEDIRGYFKLLQILDLLN